jgi:TRAP-type C4-dicarboxylate transport system substrate-binding protein
MVGHFTLVTAVAVVSLLSAAPASFAQDIQERTIRWGHLNNTDHPVSLGVKQFTDIVAAKSGGKIKVREFPSNQLGSEMQRQAALRGGTQEMQSPATTSLVGIVKEFGLIDFPFIVSTPEQADALLDGSLGTALLTKLPDKDLIGLAFWDLG